MTITFLAPDGVAVTAQQFRQAQAATHGGGAGRRLGGRSGFRVDTPSTVLTATSTTWTLGPCAAMIDPGATTHQGVYGWSSDANVTGSVTAADATYARKDIVYIQVNDSSAGDGSGALTANVLYLAGPADGTNVAPALPARSFLVGTISVPVSGGGSPTVALNPARYAAAGAPLPVYSLAERDALDKFDGLSVLRLDLPNRPVQTWDGVKWCTAPLGFLGSATNGGPTTTGTTQNTLVSSTVDLHPNRRIVITAKALARPDTAAQYAEYSIWAGTLQLEAYVMRLSGVELGESLEFTAAHGSGVGGSTTFHLKCKLINTGAPAALIKSDAFAIKLSITDAGNG